MCGISGIVYLNKRKANLQDLICQMTYSLSHRGPDDEGYVFLSGEGLVTAGGDATDEDCFRSSYLYSPSEHISNIKGGFDIALGHRRLSIIDLSAAGHQPMCSGDGKLWIVHNGEIYNYIELRRQLYDQGYSFISNTDTEVILKAYEQWGEDCVKRFNGMWSFAILDLRKNILFCSRDRFGVKPFYYFHDENYFAFGSEIKSLLTLPFVPNDYDDCMIYNYLLWGETEYKNRTFYRKITKLMNSNNMALDLKTNKLRSYKYYNLEYNPEFGRFDDRKAGIYSEAIKQKITDAVRLRLRSDVPVGTCLSGGIDSSAVFMTIRKLLSGNSVTNAELIGGHRQKAFTSCFEDKRYDERKYAEIIVNETDADWYRVFPEGSELWDDLEELAFIQDEPFKSTSIYSQYRVMKLAKESGIKVILDGQGGDELFGGYGYHLESYLLDIMKNNINPFIFLEELKKIRQNSSVGSFKGLSNTIMMAFLKKYSPDKVIKFLNRNRTVEFKYLNKDFINDSGKCDRGYSRVLNMGLNNVLWQDMNSTNLQRLLKWEDLNSMAFSIESRTPFSDDHELIEYVFSIPSCYKINDGWMKWIFRESLKGVVPEKIRLRKDKKGFVTSEKDWLIEGKDAIREIFIQKSRAIGKYIDAKKVILDLEKVLNHKNYKQSTGVSDFWRLVNLAAWAR